MRILHIFDHSIPLHSGYAFRSLAILREQRKLGYETLHLTSPKHFSYEGDALEEEVDGLHFYRSRINSNLAAKLPIINQWGVITATRQRIKQILKQEKVDIIQAHSPCLNGLAALSAAKQFGIPLLYEMRASWEDAAVNHGSCHEGDLRYRLSRSLESYVLKRADAITTICQGLKEDISIRGIDESRITIIPNAVDIESFIFNGEVDHSLQIKLQLDGSRVIGFIGSFYHYEGLELLVDAFPEILRHNPKTKLLFVGGGLQERALKNQVAALGIENQVIFCGRVPHDEVQRYYNLVDIFVYPRLSMRLTDLVTPLKPIEAMAQGRLVVASNVGGHREIIKDGETGLLFDAGNGSDLAKKVIDMIDILDSPDNKQRLLQSARDYVENKRNWAVSVKGYERVFNSLVNSN